MGRRVPCELFNPYVTNYVAEMESELTKEREITDTAESLVSSKASSKGKLFNPKWAMTGAALAVVMSLTGTVLGVGLLGGMTGLALMGMITALLSDESVIAETSAAGFIVAAGGAFIGSLLSLSLLGIMGGFIISGFFGLLAAALGGFAGEFIKRRV